MRTRLRDSRFYSAVAQSFLRACSKIGLLGLPRQIGTILLLTLVFSLGRNIAYPYLMMYLNGTRAEGGLAIGSSLIGTIIMIGTLTYTFSLFAAGHVCDRFGRKKMMTLSMIIDAFLTIGYFYAKTYTEFLLLYSATGITLSFYDPAQSAMIADLIPPERREEIYGLSYMVGNIGTMAGPVIGGVLASSLGYSILFVYAAIAASITGAGLALFIRESYRTEGQEHEGLRQFTEIFRHRLFMAFCILGTLTNLVYTQLYGLLSVYTQNLGFSPYIFGILFALNGTMVVTLQIPIRKIATHVGSTKAFVVAQLLYAAGFTYFMFSRTFAEFMIGVVVLTLGEIIFVPASTGFVANLSPPDKRGRYMAILGFFFGIGGALGSQIAFTIFDRLQDKSVTWGVLGTIGFATVIGYLSLHRERARREA